MKQTTSKELKHTKQEAVIYSGLGAASTILIIPSTLVCIRNPEILNILSVLGCIAISGFTAQNLYKTIKKYKILTNQKQH